MADSKDSVTPERSLWKCERIREGVSESNGMRALVISMVDESGLEVSVGVGADVGTADALMCAALHAASLSLATAMGATLVHHEIASGSLEEAKTIRDAMVEKEKGSLN